MCCQIPHQIVPSIPYNSLRLLLPLTEALDSCQTYLWPSPQGPSLLTTYLHTCRPCGMFIPGHFLLPCATLISLKTAHGNPSRPNPFNASLALKPARGPNIKLSVRVCVCVHKDLLFHSLQNPFTFSLMTPISKCFSHLQMRKLRLQEF